MRASLASLPLATLLLSQLLTGVHATSCSLQRVANVEAAQVADELEARFTKLVERYTNADISRAWLGARLLEQMGEEVIPYALELIKDDSTLRQLLACKVLMGLEEDRGVEKRLRQLAAAADNPKPQRLAAIELLGQFESGLTAKLLNKILDGVDAYDPELRIGAARSIFNADGDTRKCRDSLLPLLEVDDLNVQAQAALALGEMGYIESKIRRILIGLRDEPSNLGLQARLVLSHELLLRRLERSRDQDSAGSSNLKQSREVARLERELEARSRQLKKNREELTALRERMARGNLAHPLISNLLDRIEQLYVDPDLIDRNALIIEAAKGMVASLDPFSLFMDAADTKSFHEGISGEYAGIGARVAKDQDTDFLKILKPIYSGPAYEAGLQTDDLVSEVEGLSTKGLTVDELIKNLKGMANTPITMKVMRRGWRKAREFTMKRRLIKLDSVHSTMLPGQLGYLHLSQFGDSAIQEINLALDELEGKSMRGLILDLRNNPGGYLSAAVNLVDAFVGKQAQPIVTQRDKGNRLPPVQHYSQAKHRGDYPIVVLINESSASAAEIVSGALQDYGRATLVGKKSYGKGSVQRLLSLPPSTNKLLGGESTLRLTVQYYYLPSGRSIHTQRDLKGRIINEGGVTPDVSFTPTEIPLYRISSLNTLYDNSAINNYVAQYWASHQQLLINLATGPEGSEISGYPDLEKYFADKNPAHAKKEDIRFAVRQRIRRLLEDERGAEFACDFYEDEQLQKAIAELAKKLDLKLEQIDAYLPFAKKIQLEK